ncbi:hypothetical protein AGDE_11005 [Angomonas deanei]|nr:hypothetical protein AGDE_11005 [Angomonas deanei]|eukprot:EPY26961.1 hypothetical protein AGDE_11005 [Angomonas deanei]
MPLLPPKVIEYFEKCYGTGVKQTRTSHFAANSGPRRLLHCHDASEPARGLDVLGSLVASSSPDKSLFISSFYPTPEPVVSIPQPHALRSVKLWEGSAFVRQYLQEENIEEVDQREQVAVYVFSSDEASEIRLWRVDVVRRSYLLLHVFVMCPNMMQQVSSLSPFTREDQCKKPTLRQTTSPAHCLTVDGNERLIVGTEGMVYVWSLDRLFWKCDDVLPRSHPLCSAEDTPLPARGDRVLPLLTRRVDRLVNYHVWVREEDFVQREMAANEECKWKEKYGRTIAGGAAVGVVSNLVKLHEAAAISDALTHTTVPVSFEGGEVKNDIALPLSCVEPVVYPLCGLRTSSVANFAVLVLEPGSRLVTSGSDGRIGVWRWTETDQTYRLLFVTNSAEEGLSNRSLGRHLCLLRSPDIFLSASYDEGIVKEWHLYDEPQPLLRCERQFTLMPSESYNSLQGGGSGGSKSNQMDSVKKILQSLSNPEAQQESESDSDSEGSVPPAEEVVSGVSCVVSFPAFHALFLVGAFESDIQTYSLSEVQGCTAPSNYIYNGYKTVKLPSSLPDEAYSS